MSATSLRTVALALLLSLTLASAQVYNVEGRRQAAAATYDLIDGESFDATGYDESGWTSYTSGGGATVDPDETATCPVATGFSSQCLETSATTNNRKYMGYNTLVAGAQSGDVYCRVYFHITSSTGLDTGESFVLAALSASGTTPDATTSPLRIFLDNLSGQLRIIGNCAGASFGTTNVSVTTTYLLEMYASQTADSCDFKLDSVATGPQSQSFATDITVVNLGVGSALSQQADIVFDSVACDTGGWIGGI